MLGCVEDRFNPEEPGAEQPGSGLAPVGTFFWSKLTIRNVPSCVEMVKVLKEN